MAATRPMTAEEFLALPEGWPRAELIDGELVVNQPGLEHQRVLMNVLLALQDWQRAGRNRGEVTLPLDVQLDRSNVLASDLLWYAVRRTDEEAASRPYPVPDLAVEVRSPSTWRYDIGRKRELYLEHGLRELWLVDTASRSFVVVTPEETSVLSGPDVLTSPLLPEFALGVSSIF